MTSTATPSELPAADEPARVGYAAVFAVREFRAVFAAHLLSLLGVVVCELSLSVLVYRLTGSPLLSALTFALGFLPYVVGGTLLSGIADRFPARRVLVVCDLLCAGAAVGMALPMTPVGVLLVLRCVSALVAPVFSGTRAATLGDILGDGDLFVLGRSLVRLVSQGAQLVGFAAGGVLLTVLQPRNALGVTVAGFVASALLLRFGTRRRPARADAGGALVTSSLTGAWRLLTDRRVRGLILLVWIPPFFLVAPEGLAAPYADSIGAGSVGLGLLMCGTPVGAIIGEVLAGSLLGPRARERVALPVAVLSMLPFVAFAWRPPVPWALPALMAVGAGMLYTLGVDQWFIAAVPEELRGRAMTFQAAGLMTIQGLGMAAAGAAAEFAPPHAVIAGVGVVGVIATGLVARSVRSTHP
ncbi:MFS transporter [Streptomyces sp. I05A-00742]|uniref:MFS transporter n=1 Tax=Streptomyces sp. I05A-00742 TaxID=2732853 RepID=UPI001488ABC0|nr:MFS transporter [Streptomyces sp. I05A-00742]